MKKRMHDLLQKWYVQLFLILLPLVLGFIGYLDYYTQEKADCPAYWAVFSSLKMFLLSFDGAKKPDNYSRPIFLHLLMIAQFFAPIVTAHNVFRLLVPRLRPLRAQFNYWKWLGKKKELMLIGCHAENCDIYGSAGKDYARLVFCEKDEDAAALQKKGVAFALTDAEEAIVKSIKKAIRSPGKKCTIIINTHDEGKNLALCRAAVDCIKAQVGEKKRKHDSLAQREDEDACREMLKIEKEIVALLDRLRVVVLGGGQYRAVCEELQKDALGIMRYTNRAELTALHFVMDHPLTESLTGEKAAILDGQGCVDPDAAFQVLLVGFGETNKEILKTYISTNQFIVSGEKVPRYKPVIYHIFDRKDMAQDGDLSRTVNRYEDFRKHIEKNRVSKDGYLPLPPLPADIHLHRIDAEQADFIRTVREICTEHPKSVNILVITFEDDLASVDLAQRVMQAQREWGGNNLKVYARCKKEENRQIAKALSSAGSYTLFGMDKLSLNVILHDWIEKMAFARNRVYLMEDFKKSSRRTPKSAEELDIRTAYSWHTMDIHRRLSNWYDVLSLRMKLQLIGLDITEKQHGSPGLKSEADYDRLYAPELRGADGKRKEGKVSSIEAFYSGSKRGNLAVQEHYRWNGYMMARGFVPASVSDIQNKSKEQFFALRIHGNLTTFEGLFDYLKLTGKNVVNSDFEVMDGAWGFLNDNGREIVRR